MLVECLLSGARGTRAWCNGVWTAPSRVLSAACQLGVASDEASRVVKVVPSQVVEVDNEKSYQCGDW